VAATRRLKVGPGDDDDLGPVINDRQLSNMLSALEQARQGGSKILTGGERLTDAAHAKGCYLAPTVVEGATPDATISTDELFGPITCLYRTANFATALAMANDSPYGLTASIHTRSFDRAIEFTQKVKAGVAVVNGGTYGSEPHMPFGGFRQSGNGSREPGVEALDVYSELKDVYMLVEPTRL
jgi:aldehyde dehydrogenase (NAD+)